MNIRATAARAILTALVASTAAAQTPPATTTSPASTFLDQADGLSLDQALARARAQEPSIRAARTSVDAARGGRQQAGLRRNPAVSMEWRDEPSGTDNQLMVNLDWPLDLFRKPGRVAVADRAIAAAELSVADRERMLAAAVRARFGDVLVAVRELTVLEELAVVARRQFDVLRTRVDIGASPPLERDLLDVEVRRIDAERAMQLGRVERALLELKRLLGMPPAETLRLRDSLEAVVAREAAEPAAAAGDAAERRTDVREAAARVAEADARLDLAERDGRFDVSLFGGYTRMDAGFPQFGVSPAGMPERVRGTFHYVSAGAMVTLPVLNRHQGEVAVAKAERTGAAAAREATMLAAQTDIASARIADARAREAVRLYGASGLSLARQNLNVIVQSYELGRTTIFDVLTEQRRFLELERAYTETLRAAFEARTALKNSLGEWP
jgi:cobalt-zinc-cadmium efflux system outer membrane protein